MLKTNYHTHSVFCDGNNTAEEMVISAIEKKIEILGFSSHAMFPFASDWHISLNSYNEYISEINRLKDKYSDKIKIYTGFEADYMSGLTFPDFERYADFSPDFLIGSVHFVPGEKGFFEADGNHRDVSIAIEKYFNGDIKKAVQEYFALEREMLKNCNFTFLGHADLIRKQNIGCDFFDENSCWYKTELAATAKAVSESGVCVEVNTGGILRSGMKYPYPSPYFLTLLKEYNVPVTINSDAHTADGLDFWFEEAVEYIKKAGYTELSYYEAGSLKTQKIV